MRLDDVIAALRERTALAARQEAMRREPCRFYGCAWERCESDSRLQRCVRCQLVRIKRYRKAPRKALQHVAKVVGAQQLSAPGPFTNRVVTARVWITDDLMWQRETWRGVGAYFFLKVYVPRIGWVSPTRNGVFAPLDEKYRRTIKAAAKHVHADALDLYAAIRAAVGERWFVQPEWWPR